ncbi:periplasmic binding protein-like II [Thozetella sp. PMI_491]|nr:periplasmic binding protein-like II [Thozetella sp. PMI_491]
MFHTLLAAALLGGVVAYDVTLGFNLPPIVENRTLDEIYHAALAEGGIVTAWHGGDEKTQQDGLKQQFEQRFPGMTLNITVDLSKYHNGRLDRQLAAKNVYVDSILLQTLHDYPRWAQEGALLNYAPLNFENVHPAFRDVQAAYYGVTPIAWAFVWNYGKLGENISIAEFPDFLDPRLKGKLVLTYPNDDDAVLYAFDLIMQQYGTAWFDALLAQNPRWVRGTATPASLILNSSVENAVATFTSFVGFSLDPSLQTAVAFPEEGSFVSWAQGGAILKDAPHPEGAKLFHSWLLSDERQDELGWSVLKNASQPAGFPFPDLWDVKGTNPSGFAKWMQNRSRLERLRNFFEDVLGTAQGLSPLIDDL